MYTPVRENSGRCLVAGHFSRGNHDAMSGPVHAVNEPDAFRVAVGHENTDGEWTASHLLPPKNRPALKKA